MCVCTQVMWLCRCEGECMGIDVLRMVGICGVSMIASISL